MPGTEINKGENKLSSKHTAGLAYALATFTAIWILALFGGIEWSSLDDPVISYLIRHSSESVTVFEQKWLVKILNILSSGMPLVNYWAITNVFGISSGVAVCCGVVSKRCSRRFAFIFAVFAVAISYIFALRAINFTCSSLISFCGGAALTIDSVYVANKKKTFEYLIGLCLMLLSFGIRMEAGLIGLGYLAVLGALSLDFSVSPLKKDFYSANKRRIILLVIPAVICIGSLLTDRISYSDADKEYYSYNNICAGIRDYSSAYPSWESGEEVYSSIGLSSNDYDLLFNRWVFDDTEVFTKEKLEKVAVLKYSQTPLKVFLLMPFDAFRGMLSQPSLMVLLALAIGVTGISMKRKMTPIWKLIILWLFEFCYYMYIVINGRIVTHVLFSILWGLNICLILICCVDIHNKGQEKGPGKKDRCLSNIYPCAILILAVVAAAGINVTGNALQTVNNDYGTSLNDNRAFYDLLDSRREDTFIFAPNLYKHSSKAYGPWSPFPEKYCENVFYLGGWQARTGYMVENLKERGIENPMRALLEGNRVYSMIDENTPGILTFLREHYDPTASYSIVELINSEQIIRYCGSLGEVDSVNPGNISETHAASCNISAGTPMVIISGELKKDDSFEDISEVFCTLHAGNSKYSYLLAYDGSCTFSGCPIVVDAGGAEPNFDTIEILIKTSSGKLLEVPKQTENN